MLTDSNVGGYNFCLVHSSLNMTNVYYELEYNQRLFASIDMLYKQ